MRDRSPVYRLLFVFFSLQGGGAERVILNLIDKLPRDQFSPSIFLLRNEGAYLSDVPEEITVSYGTSAGRSVIFNAPLILARLAWAALRSDLVIGSNELTATYFSAISGLLLRKPTIGWVHVDIREFSAAHRIVHRVVIRLTYPLLASIVCVSHGVAEAVSTRYPKLQPRIRVLDNVIDVTRIQEMSLRHENFKTNSRMILGIGRLVGQKGFDILIRAHAVLMKRSIEQELVILGDGPERADLERLAIQLGVTGSVHFMGFVTNPYSWIRMADVFVLSSRYEGLPTVILEALAIGTPVVATRCPSGPAEILMEGKYGLLAKSEDANDIARCVEMVLSDVELSRSLREIGPIRARAYAPSSVVPKHVNMLKSLLEHRIHRNPQ